MKRNCSLEKISDGKLYGLNENQQFILDWHNYLKELEKGLEGKSQEEQKAINLQLLGVFFMESYQEDRDFYVQFYERLSAVRGQVVLK